jgi:hypothetical protein
MYYQKPVWITVLTGAFAVALAAGFADAAEQAAPADKLPVPAHGVLGVNEAQLSADFWIAKLRDPDRVVLDANAIAMRNSRLQRVDTSMHDLRALPATLSREQVTAWITDMSERPDRELFDDHGGRVDAHAIDALLDALALDQVPATQPTRYGLVVHRADLRTFPTTLRVFSSRGDTDIDRFQC